VLGSPREVVQAAAELIHETLGKVLALSSVIDSAPVGPSQRRYANAALVLKTKLEPHELLTSLQWLETQLGRKRRGQRWRARVIDLDVVLWTGGVVAEPRLAVPHPLFRQRDFVLRPAAAIAPGWRDPLTGLTLAQLHARLTRRRPLPR
jgi:2-amino-4-hydroxy-6-hydroxymethyldihydropteridine diphosphokinase